MLTNKNFANNFTLIYEDVVSGINLEEHLTDVNKAILQVEAIIADEDTEPLPLEFWQEVRKELYTLRDEIVKRL